MMRQATILAAAMVTASVTMASAQPYYGYGPRGVMPPPMPSPYGGPVVVVPPPPPMMRPPVVTGVPPYEPGIPSYEVVHILRTTGFLPLGAPMRRGRFYVIAAIHPNGDDGRVTIDAMTGRFVRFVPADGGRQRRLLR